MLDGDRNVLDIRGGQRFCVDGKWMPWDHAVRKDTWGFDIDSAIFARVHKVSILQSDTAGDDPMDRIARNVAKAKELAANRIPNG